jgi:hypothetical protein
MFIEISSPLISVAHLWAKDDRCAPKGASRFNCGCLFYKHFTATRFFPTDSEGAAAITANQRGPLLGTLCRRFAALNK